MDTQRCGSDLKRIRRLITLAVCVRENGWYIMIGVGSNDIYTKLGGKKCVSVVRRGLVSSLGLLFSD